MFGRLHSYFRIQLQSPLVVTITTIRKIKLMRQIAGDYPKI
ncbi:translocase [Blastopirellula marina DSM 3645]|uniref:Translocase n=1 Tax=Blastopirellula marina DSM 3645 TaxID=314230 RepID=A4A1J2_9BACT|nr:translocase [Blastopirellula marina DSM 3645]